MSLSVVPNIEYRHGLLHLNISGKIYFSGVTIGFSVCLSEIATLILFNNLHVSFTFFVKSLFKSTLGITL